MYAPFDLSSHIIVLVEFINQLCISNVVYIWDDIGCDVLFDTSLYKIHPICNCSKKYIPIEIYLLAQ